MSIQDIAKKRELEKPCPTTQISLTTTLPPTLGKNISEEIQEGKINECASMTLQKRPAAVISH